MLQSLYYMSDHLPIVLKLNMGVGSVSVDENHEDLAKIWITDNQLNIQWQKKRKMESFLLSICLEGAYFKIKLS